METQEEGKRVERRMTPELKAALDQFIPITADPIDRFTPPYFRKEYPKEKWPVIHIRRPGSLDLIAGMAQAAADEATAKLSATLPAEDKAAQGKPLATMSHADVAALGKEAIKTWKERVVKFENMTAYDESLVEFHAEKGVITDACLNQVPWRTFLAVHFRYNALFALTDLEREGLESQPASA